MRLSAVAVIVLAAMVGRVFAQPTNYTSYAKVKSIAPPPGSGLPHQQVVEIELDHTGVSSWRFLNRRDPPYIFGGGPSGPFNPGPHLQLRFVNRTDRTLKIRIPVKGTIANGPDPATTRGPIAANDVNREVVCRRPDAPCELTVTVHRNVSVDVPITALATFSGSPPRVATALGYDAASASMPPPVSYEVEFFNDVLVPANPTGYFRLVHPNHVTTPSGSPASDYEPENSTRWALTAKAAGSRDPDFGGDEAVLDANTPYDDAHRWHWPASGSLRLRQTLGNRAEADVTVQYFKGDFGGSADARSLRVTRFRTNVFGYRGATLSFGRDTMADPSDSIAIDEAGDGAQLRFRAFTASFVIDREGFRGKATDDQPLPVLVDRDKATAILRWAQPLPSGSRHLRSSDVYLLVGRDTTPGAAYDFGTAGGEVIFGDGVKFTTTLADYVSWRSYRGENTTADDHGNVALAKIARRWLTPIKRDAQGRVSQDQERETAATATLTVGWGTSGKGGDRPSAAYTGETAAFAPDGIFLASLAGQRIPGVPGSLNGKSYLGLALTSERFSPLAWFADQLGTAADNVAEATTAQFNVYRLNEPMNGARMAGSELDLQFQLESPGGVEQVFQLAWYFPGKAVEPLFKGTMWSASLGITVKLF